jgi:uroporphyrin-III C-methyltransferase/precorrin-2 dehydrogenase/sirohydrochlorin ferrochelatase
VPECTTRPADPQTRPTSKHQAAPSASAEELLPVFLNVGGRKVVVVGGGRVAATKVRSLLRAGARITVVAPEVSKELRHAPVKVAQTRFRAEHLHGAWLVVAAATREVNRQVRDAADRYGVFVNVVDDAERATAYLGGVVRRGDVTLAVSTGGAAPALAALLREALESLLTEDTMRWGEIARRQRLRWREEQVPWSARRPLLLEALQRLYRCPEGVNP